MAKLSADELQYIEQFIRDYRAGSQVFVKASSQSDKDLISGTLFSMERYELMKSFHREALARPPLTIGQAAQRAKRNWLRNRKDPRQINELLLHDDMERSGANENIAAHAFKLYLDKARSHRLICVSEIARKFNECTEKSADMLRQLDDAHRKIIRLDTMIRLLGANPDEASSYTGSTEEGRD